MITKYLLFFWSNVSVLTLWDFRYSFKTCPALGGGTLAPFLLIWYSLAFSDQFTVFQSFTTSISFFQTFSFLYGFFFLFCLNRWNVLCQSILRNHGYYFSKGLSKSLLTYRVNFFIYHWPYIFHFLLCWLEDFFSWKLFGSNFTSMNASLLLATQPVLFFKRLLSTCVVKRQHLHSSTWHRVFLPWAVFCQLSVEYAFRYCCFFSGGDHCEIWLSMALYFLIKRPIDENINFCNCTSFFYI